MDSGAAFWLFLAVGAASFFSFIAVAVWSGSRYAERETYYRNELVKKAMESSSTAGLEYLRERDREAAQLQAKKSRSAIRLGGLVAVAAGIGLAVFLKAITVDERGGEQNVYLLGLIPILVGTTIFFHSLFSSNE